MAFELLDILLEVLAGDAGISGLVDARIHKFLPIEKSEALLKSGNCSLISCELQDWGEQEISSDPVFVVDIRSRKGDDKGAEYCSEIVSAVTELLLAGFGSVQVSKIDGRVRYDKNLVGYRCQLMVYGHIGTGITLSLSSSLTSPQPAGTSIIFVATASLDGLEYRFLLQGPGTGNQWRDLTGWSSRNSISWKPTEEDAGSSNIKVQVRGGKFKAGEEQEATIAFEITISGDANELPSISSLTAIPASQAEEGDDVVIICSASDPEGDSVSYRFLVNGPGTGGTWRDLSGWIARNSFTWHTQHADIGNSSIKCQILDGKHAGAGGYDDEATTACSVQAAGGGGSNALPAITGLYPSLSSPRGAGTEIEFICIATDADLDSIYYRFYLTGPGTANKKKLVQDWSQKNAWRWEPSKKDIGTSAIQVQIRDGQHAGVGSFDDSESIAFVISDNSIPAINSLHCNESGTHYVGDKVHIVANASDPDGDKLLFRFWIYRESVGAAWEQLTEWQEKNWLLYELDEPDFETITFKAQVRDEKHAGEESYDAEKTLVLSVSRASLTSVTPSLSSPQAHENTIVFTAATNKTAGIYYRFWQKGPGTGNQWRDWTGWQQKNSWSWRTLACDVGSNQVKVQVCDDPDTWNDGDTSGREITLNYTIS